MRKKFLLRAPIGLLLLVMATAASAQELTQAEKERALQYLESTKANIVEATKGLSSAQWNFKSAPDRWSIAQVMEHIAASEDFIRDGFAHGKGHGLAAGAARPRCEAD